MAEVANPMSEGRSDPAHRAVRTSSAPAPGGPYTQAISFPGAGLVFVSGQLPLDLVTGELLGATAGDQAEVALRHALALVEASGGTPAHVVKTTLFVVDLDAIAQINEAYARCFGDTLPTRTTVEVRRLPRGAQVEVDLIAAIPTGA
jgi:2-iminobutanoate/2-iminopropanoate deaminase